MQACVIEDLGAIECLKRSWMVTKGNVLLIFVTVLIIGILGLIFTIPFTIAGNFGIPFISMIGMFVTFTIMGPVQVIILVSIVIQMLSVNF